MLCNEGGDRFMKGDTDSRARAARHRGARDLSRAAPARAGGTPRRVSSMREVGDTFSAVPGYLRALCGARDRSRRTSSPDARWHYMMGGVVTDLAGRTT